MKTALVDGIEVQADPTAPAEAICPTCGDPVALRVLQRGDDEIWYYLHDRGMGANCPRRQGRAMRVDSVASQVRGDPYRALALAVAEGAVVAARRGDLRAILSLAFSPLVHAALSVVDLSPEEVMDTVVPPPPIRRQALQVVVANDEGTVLDALKRRPGPVFDLRGRHNGHLKALAGSAWYVPLPEPVGLTQAEMVRKVLEWAKRVYVLGGRERWKHILKRA
jgi:hypothetical protein